MKWQSFVNTVRTQSVDRVLAATPTTLTELQATIRFARSANLSVRAVGSGLSWSPLYSDENQMVVYMKDVAYPDLCKSRLRINQQVGSQMDPWFGFFTQFFFYLIRTSIINFISDIWLLFVISSKSRYFKLDIYNVAVICKR